MAYTLVTDLRLQSRLEHENYCPAHDFEHFHDLCLVRPLEVPKFAPLDRHRGKLVHRPAGILLYGTCEPHRILSIQHCSAENHPGGHHPGGFRRFFHLLFERRVQVELSGRVWPDGWRCILHV